MFLPRSYIDSMRLCLLLASVAWVLTCGSSTTAAQEFSPTAQLSNPNPNNWDTKNIMQAIRHPHDNLTILSAHRGIHALAALPSQAKGVPENSLQSIALAAQAGWEVVEIDIRLTSDNVPILTHDKTWGREWCGSGSSLSYQPYNPFTQPGNSTNDAANPAIGTKTAAQMQSFANFAFLRDSVSLNCTNTWPFWSNVYAPTLQTVLNYIRDQHIHVVLALDTQAIDTVQYAWPIVQNAKDDQGNSFAQSTVFKLPWNILSPASNINTMFGDAYPNANIMPVITTSAIAPPAVQDQDTEDAGFDVSAAGQPGLGGEPAIENMLADLWNYNNNGRGHVSMAAIEVVLKEPGGILSSKVLPYAKTNQITGFPETIGNFNPVGEYYPNGDLTQTPQFFRSTNGSCCDMLSQYLYNNPNGVQTDPNQPIDTSDQRTDINFISGTGAQFITTDAPKTFADAFPGSRITAPMQTGGPIGFTYCSTENELCQINAAAEVAFGTPQGPWTYADFFSSFECKKSNFAFDPAPGVAKLCYYQPDTTGGSSSSGTGGTSGAGANTTGTTIAQQVAVPAYFYPPAYWSQLVAPVGFAVANVANGPNYGVDSNYASAIAASHKAGTRVLGYVDTGYFGGTTPARTTRLNQTDVNSWTTQIEQDVDSWYSLYGSNGIDGIFFDDGQNVCGDNNQYVTLYTDILNYVKQNHPGAYVITNPGVTVPQCLENTADTLLTFEGSYDCYINDSACAAGQGYTPLGWTPVDPRKIYHIVYDIPAASLANASALSKQNNAGLVFLTSATLAGNPYGSLPSYFSTTLADANPGGGADTTIPTTPDTLGTVNVQGTNATVNWVQSTDANGSGVVAYDVYQNGVWVTSVPASTAPQVTVTGLQPSTTYNIYVKARNAAGTVSAASNQLSFETNSANGNVTAPTLTNWVANDTDVMLTWTASQADTYPLAYYDVFVDGVKTVTVDAGVTSADMIQLLGTLLTDINVGLPIKTSYTFTVQARDTQGDVSPMSNSVKKALPEPPSATSCAVTTTATTVTIGCNYWAPWGFHHVYIDADNSAATGYLFSWTSPSLGADYLIENDRLLSYTGTGSTFSWAPLATIEPVVTGSDSAGFIYTWTIPLSDFSVVPLGTTSLFLLNGNGYVPEAYSGVLTHKL